MQKTFHHFQIKASLSCKHHRALAAELMVMSTIGHHVNVLAIIGAIVDGIDKEEFCIIFELCSNGSLLDYLQNRRNSFVDLLIDSSDHEAVTQVLGGQYKKISFEVSYSLPISS